MTTERIVKRIPIEVSRYVNEFEYKFLDYILYRNNLHNYTIHVSTMVNEMNISKKTILKLCKKLKEMGILNQGQSDTNNKHKMCYSLNYNNCMDWFNNLIKVGPSHTPTLKTEVGVSGEQVGVSGEQVGVSGEQVGVSGEQVGPPEGPYRNFKGTIKENITGILKQPENLEIINTPEIKTVTQLEVPVELLQSIETIEQEKLATEKTKKISEDFKIKLHCGKVTEQDFDLIMNCKNIRN